MPSTAHYINLRDQYKPRKTRVIFILESPPASGEYFYDPDGRTGEQLFSAMMKVINYQPKDKADGLAEFQKKVIFSWMPPISQSTK
jgi:hypothetical protein